MLQYFVVGSKLFCWIVEWKGEEVILLSAFWALNHGETFFLCKSVYKTYGKYSDKLKALFPTIRKKR